MTELDIPDESLDSWLQVLKPYQREQINAWMEDGNPEDAAERWVTTIGDGNIAKFGGTPDPKPFWTLLKAEFYDFVCDANSYKSEKVSVVR